jgi:DNA-binding transcriptional MerR regulator
LTLPLLSPAHVDEWTGYRYYAADQARDAIAIRRLRELELPLDEIPAAANPSNTTNEQDYLTRVC